MKNICSIAGRHISAAHAKEELIMEDLMNDINSPVRTQSSTPAAKSVSTYDTAWDDIPVPEPVRATESYSSYSSYSAGSDSVVLEAVKGLLGAMVGAIPGVLLWIIIGRIGFVAAICGAILAAGVVAGYTFMTKDSIIPQIWGVVICLAVVVIAVYFAERVVWSWELADYFAKYMSETRNELYALGEAGGMTSSEVDEIIDREMMSTYGFTEGTFSEFFSNFHRTLGIAGYNGKYFFNLLTSYAFAGMGGLWLFKKARG